jgi:hypothetical protein
VTACSLLALEHFVAKLDLRGLYPSIRINESGRFDLAPSPR